MGTPPHDERWRGVYLAALLFLYLFLVLAVYIATKATRDALFIARFGADALPYADIASAACVALAMSVYLRMGRRLSLPRLQTGTLLVFAAAGLSFWWAGRRFDPSWLLPVLYVWASVFGVLLPVQVWTLANHVVTPRQAKRLFGLVGSGAITGWIAGGFLTRAVAERAGADTLLLITAGALVAAVALVWTIWRERPAWRPQSPGPPSTGLVSGLGFLRRSHYLSMVAFVVALSALVTTIASWQFRAVAGASIRDADELAAFFGTFNFYAGGLSLVTQVIITGPLLQGLGLGAALLAVPLALTGGSLALAISGALWAAVVLKGGDQVLRYAIDRPAVELLYLPLSDGDTFVAKSIIDTVVLRTGDLLGSGVVLAALAFSVSPAGLGVVTLALAVAWVAASVAVRRAYVQQLLRSIRAHRLDAERLEEATRRDRTAASAVAEVARLEAQLADDDPAVRSEAFLALARLTSVDPLERLGDLDEVRDVSLHLALVAYLSRPGPQQNTTAANLLLDAAFAAASAEAGARIELAGALEVLPDQTLIDVSDTVVPLVDELLKTRHAPTLRRRAPGLLQRIGTPAAERVLVEHLTDPDPEVRLQIVSALNILRQEHPDRGLNRELVETALSAEILGHYRSHQILQQSPSAAIDLGGELERIFRLLKLLFPAYDLQSAYVGARSLNPGVQDHALEFLEHTLPVKLRELLIPLLDREASPEARRAFDEAVKRLERP